MKKVAKSDLDVSRSFEVIAATCKRLWVKKMRNMAGFFVWDEMRNQVTEYNLWKPSIYPAHEPCTNISDFKITDLENGGILEIVVAVCGEQYYPSRIVVLHL